MPRPGLNYDYCKDIPPLIAINLGKSWAEALGDEAAAICGSIRAAKNYKDWENETKECDGVVTPVLKMAPIKLTMQNLPGLNYSDAWTAETPEGEVVDDPPPNAENLFYSLDFWLGVEHTANGVVQCVWFGIDGPTDEGETMTLACGKVCPDGDALPVKDIHTLVDDVLNDLAAAADDGSAINIIIQTLKAIILLVIAAGLVHLVVTATTATVTGAALLGLGGALVGSIT